MCPKDQGMGLGISQNTSRTIYLQHLHKSKREKGSESRLWAVVGRRSVSPSPGTRSKADMPFTGCHLE